MSIITLLTDFGNSDYYVAALHGVLLSRAPASRTVDVSHRVAAGDIAGASWLLDASWQWFPEGTVHLAIVDPGVGSKRRILAVQRAGHFFIAPDNGLLTSVLRREDSPIVHRVERPDLYLDTHPSAGRTFAGRDRFAPIAAALARRESLGSLGPQVSDPVMLSHLPPRLEGSPGRPGTRMEGSVAHIDHYGNLVTDLPTPWLGTATCRVTVRSEEQCHETEFRASHYDEIPRGRAAVLAGSLGTLELAIAGESLAQAWKVQRGDRVDLELLSETEDRGASK